MDVAYPARDHGMNASTFAAMVIASTPPISLLGRLGHRGTERPLHGGAEQ